MKRFIVSLLAFSMASAMATEVQILDVALPLINTQESSARAKFQMDKTTGEGSVVVSVSEMRWTDFGGGYDQWGSWYPDRIKIPFIVFSDSVKVEGLALHGDQVIFAGAEGDVNCGRLGQSSVSSRPTIYLSGKCKLSTKITGTWSNARLQVTMNTK